MSCAGDDESAELTVFAAASLRDVVGELESAWLEEHPERPFIIATDGSHVLAAQIREGAPADVLLSADTLRPRELWEAGLTAAQPVSFALNRIALVAPLESDLVQLPADLARPGVRIVDANEGTPIAGYAHEARSQLAATMAQPQVFAEAVSANIVSREDNVRAALAKVELGEGDAAFVYRTDLLGSEDVREVTLPEDVMVRAQYGAVQVSEATAAADLVAWLSEPAATDVLIAAGFEVER